MKNPWKPLTLLLALSGLLALSWGRVPVDAPASALPPAPAVGHPAPDFTLPMLQSDALTLADLRGQPVVLNFWASWCGPCRAEMPELQRLHERLAASGVAVVGVNQGESASTAATYFQTLGLDFPVALDERTGVSQLYLVNSLPTTFFIDRDGIVRNVFIGPMTDAVLTQTLRSIYP
ncbi:MAG: TlpA disulfide reductase family protein [Caldilineales bacterium]|mgnify:CR=1 FL=1